MTKSLTYGAAFADVYDEWYRDDAETAATVRALTELVSHIATPRVLELGAGTGRLAIPLASALAAGVVVALDESPEMLQILRSHIAHADSSVGNVIVVEGNMADLAALSTHGATAGEPFGLVFASYNTFFNLHEPGDQARCLCAVAQLLRPDGIVVIDAFVASGDAPRHATTNEVRGEWTLQTTTDFDPVTGLIVGSTHSTHRDGREVKRPWRIRYQSPTQLDALCTAAGLELISRYGSWQMSTFGDDAARHISAYQLVR
ncbi:MAG: class I SAM-dependent methyltransferase [Actinobacteria bacterium]|jgi:predicted O-methyltransferase YrrM|nr:class I SAM-dependent methyltransferase [Actinomycetota bacterium]NDH37632.1 class I SAM-dependent methyltransferase [Acidimicrobiia bacterium]